MKKIGMNVKLPTDVIDMSLDEQQLLETYSDHGLSGNYQRVREYQIQPE